MPSGVAVSERYGQLIQVVDILESLIRNIALKHALHRVEDDPTLNFWRLIYGNQMDISVLEWCKLFGSDDAQYPAVHWKNVATDPDKFREGLFADLGIHTEEWAAYWAEMKAYRDLEVAHHDPRRKAISHYPKLSYALRSAFYYFDYVRTELKAFGVNQQPSDMRSYAAQFEEECVRAAELAMNATNGMSYFSAVP